MEYINTSDVKILLEIQKSDYQRSLYETEISLIPVKIKREEDKFAAEKSSWQDSFNALKSLQLRQREAELKASEMQAAIEKYQIQSHSVKDNAAYQSMLAQIEYARTKKDEAETSALMLLDDIEAAALKEKSAKEKMLAAEKSKNSEISKLEERKKELENYVNQENLKKSSLAAGLKDNAVFEKYEVLRNKKPKVIFSLRQNMSGDSSKTICPACNMMLTQHFTGLLRKPDLFVVCPECGAWLCLEDL